MAWAPDYATADELGSYIVSGGIGDDVDDVELALAVTAASRAIDHACNRQFGKVDAPETRSYYARPDFIGGYWVVDVDDYMVTGAPTVAVEGTTVTVFVREPLNAQAEGRPWTRVAFTASSEALPSCHPHQVDATTVWGWSSPPDTVKQATLLQGSRFFTRRNAPFGVAGSPDAGSELRLLAKVDPDVAVMLRSYRRPRGTG